MPDFKKVWTPVKDGKPYLNYIRRDKPEFPGMVDWQEFYLVPANEAETYLPFDWFEKGRNSVLRENKSGCCCIINDADEVVSACEAHKAWKEEKDTP